MSQEEFVEGDSVTWDRNPKIFIAAYQTQYGPGPFVIEAVLPPTSNAHPQSVRIKAKGKPGDNVFSGLYFKKI